MRGEFIRCSHDAVWVGDELDDGSPTTVRKALKINISQWPGTGAVADCWVGALEHCHRIPCGS